MIKQTITLPLHLQHPLRMGVRYPGGTINQWSVTCSQARAAARAAKDFVAADNIRMELEKQGIMIMDTPAGTTWRPMWFGWG